MTSQQLDTDYPVYVTQRSGGYDLKIRELLIFVHALDLQQGYAELMSRKQEIIDQAHAFDALDELPLPEVPALANALGGVSGGALSRLRRLWTRKSRGL